MWLDPKSKAVEAGDFAFWPEAVLPIMAALDPKPTFDTAARCCRDRLMDSISLPAASREDAPTIASIHVTSWRDAYVSVLDHDFLNGPIETDRLQYWNERLENPTDEQIILLARDADQRAVGFVCAIADFDATLGTRIDHLHVLPEIRGRGTGELLLRKIAGQASTRAASRSVYLWVYEANARAIAFYLRLGGQIIGREASRIPAAHGKPVLCIHWPDLSQLADSHGQLP